MEILGVLIGEGEVMKKMTNEEFIGNIMKYSRRGALIQSFVVCGLERYAESVVEAYTKGELKEGTFNFINPDAWADCAKEVLEKISDNYMVQKKAEK